MAAMMASRKRCAGSISFLDEPVPAPPHLAKRGRFTPAPAAFSAATPAAHQHPQAADTAARGDGGGMEEWAGVLVEQMSAAADLADARTRACAVLEQLVEAAVTTRVAAASASAATAALLREEENAALRARAEALERDNGVLKHGVAALHRRAEEAKREVAESKAREEEARCEAAGSRWREAEAKRDAAEMRKKVAELEAANYALAARMMGGVDHCRFQAFHGPPDVF